MSKELEALETFNYIMTRCKDEDNYIIKFPLGIQKGTTFGEDMEKAYKVIKEALQRLEAIDNIEPNEALKCLIHIKKDDFNMIITTYPPLPAYNSVTKDEMLDKIEQSLIKAQEQEKALNTIKEKNVDMVALKDSKTLEEYNRNAWEVEHYGRYKGYKLQLTQEEFNTLKEWMK